VPHIKLTAVPFRGQEDAVASCYRDGHGLLQKNVLPCLECGHGVLFVKMIRRGNEDAIDFFPGQDFSVVGREKNFAPTTLTIFPEIIEGE
jgi:hypothetical protein